MANFDNIKREIDQNVNTNGVQAITGKILNTTLKDMLQEVDDTKQDTLVAGEGIEISGNTISATGGGSGTSYTAGNGIDITGNTISTYLDPNSFDYGNDGLVILDYSNVASNLAGNGLQDDGNGHLAIDPTEVQEKLVSGQNLKTINGNSLLGSGDITISGGNGLWQSGSGTDSLVAPVSANAGLTASGDGALIAARGDSSATGRTSASFGLDNKATGDNSFAAGNHNEARGANSTAIGHGLYARNTDEVALGQYNSSHVSTSGQPWATKFSIGNGNSFINPSNAVEVRDNGKVFVNGIGGYAGSSYDNASNSLQEVVNGKQDTLVSGQNIKTINGNSLLGSGDLVISGGSALSAGDGISIANDTISAKYSFSGGISTNSNGELVVYHDSTLGTGLNGELVVNSDNLFNAGNNIQITPPVGAGGKATISATDTTYSAGTGLNLNGTTFSVDTSEIQEKLYPGRNITINGNVVSTDSTVQEKLYAGANIQISGDIISATNTTYSAGSGLSLNGTTFSADTTVLQEKLTAGSGISISGNVISATGGSGLWVNGSGYNSLMSPDAVEGQGSATGRGSISAGYATDATNLYSFAGGNGSTASGESSFAYGENNTATGLGAVAMGVSNQAASYGVSMGYSNIAPTNSVALGVSNTAHASSVAIGHSLNTLNNHEVALGYRNKSYSGDNQGTYDDNIETLFTLGNGDGSSVKNSVEIKKNNDIYVVGVGGFDGTNSASATTLQDAINNGGSGTSYTAGSGIDITGSTISVDATDLVGTYLGSTNDGKLFVNAYNLASDLDGNGLNWNSQTGELDVDTTTIQEKLTPGSNISISGSTISATDTTYSAGSGLSLNGTTFSADTTVLATQNDLSGKQDTLVSGTNIKTINGNSILGSGDITVGGGGSSYTAGNGIDITGTTISADDTYFDGKYLSLNGGSISDKTQGATGTTLFIAEPSQSYDAFVTIMADEGNPTAKEGQIGITGTYNGEPSSLQIYSNRIFAGGNGDIYFPTSDTNDTFALASEVSAKQDTLVSGTNIKTINGTSLLGSGDITVSGGSSYQAGNGIGIQNDTISVLYDSTRGIGYDNSVGHNELFVQLGNGLQFDGNGAIETTGGSGSSYTAGTGISIDSSNVITNTAPDPGLWVAGTGTGSIKTPNATSATGQNSIAIGQLATSTNAGSIGVGLSAKSQGSYSVAIGRRSTAVAENSLALGYATGNVGATNAEGYICIGYGAESFNSKEMAIGVYNKSTSTGTTAEKTFFTIGNGNGSSARSNLIEAKFNNDIYVVGIGGFDGTNAGTSGVQTLQTVIANAGSGSSGSYLPLSGGTLEGASTSTSLVIQAPQSESTANITLEALGTGSSSISLTTESSIPTDVGDFEINSDGSFTLNYVSGTNDTITLPKTTGTIALQGDLAGNNNYTESAIVYSIGIGTSSTPLNALAVDSSGNIFIKGLGGYTGTSISGATSIQTLLNSNSNESNPTGTEITNQDDSDNPGEGGWD